MRFLIVLLAMAGLLGSCENISPGQKGAVTAVRSVPASAWWPAAASAKWLALV